VSAHKAVFFRVSNILDPSQILSKTANPIHSLFSLSYDRFSASCKEVLYKVGFGVSFFKISILCHPVFAYFFFQAQNIVSNL